MFNNDNFKVSQWLEMALADGSAYMYTKIHEGNGCKSYQELLKVYQCDNKQMNCLHDLREQLKKIQYRGVKNFPWDKFTNNLHSIYKEMAMLGEPISSKVQVQHLMDAVTHSPTKHILTDTLFIHPDKKEDLAATMVMVTEKVRYYGLTLGNSAASAAGEIVSERQKIRKLQ